MHTGRSSLLPTCLPSISFPQMFGWMSWESLTLIHIVVQGGHTHYQSDVSCRLGNMDRFFHVSSEQLKCIFVQSFRPQVMLMKHCYCVPVIDWFLVLPLLCDKCYIQFTQQKLDPAIVWTFGQTQFLHITLYNLATEASNIRYISGLSCIIEFFSCSEYP